ncbi:polyprenyl synthetase family protein [Stieleria marina]|uniref:polyprenyl synthetase family protein n=1 Tax=Stieleria marina TaxID=1930275 RepID=UPI003AF3FB5A
MTDPSSADTSNSPADAKAAMDDLRQGIEQALRDATQFDSGCPDELGSAIRYALLAPGKRLRPALVLMAAEACGGSIDDAMPGAVAVEMIHAYSLIHDDLPAMDDDDLRRGRPTVHIAFDESTAILAGDALQPQAFLHLSENVSDPVRAIEAVRVLAKAAGAERLVGGQADDLAAESRDHSRNGEPIEGDDRSLQQLESIHRRKTGALFAASLELGAVLSGASEQARNAVVDYANDLGLAFQVVDDLLDYEADESRLGKRAGKDAERGKLTYPGLLGIEAAREKARELIESAQSHVKLFGDAAWRLNTLANFVLQRTH